ncbi:MAG: lysozyme [Muribaculaceae bacterium]|nr:lysozyme [Muribaculaceae bacterium]
MKKLSTILLVLLAVMIPAATCLPGFGKTDKGQPTQQVESVSSFERAVQIIKKYEGLHKPQHWPLIGYGHLVKPGEKYSRSKALSEKEAEALLRKDLLKNCAAFREFGKDSLILGVLAYNIGSGNTRKSSVVKKLRNGDRNIKENYLSHCRYKGKVLAGLKKRRVEEFEALFETDTRTSRLGAEQELTASLETKQQTKVSASTSKAKTATESGERNLTSSIFSPVRMMLGALSHPFTIATSVPQTSKSNQTINLPLTSSLCVPSI